MELLPAHKESYSSWFREHWFPVLIVSISVLTFTLAFVLFIKSTQTVDPIRFSSEESGRQASYSATMIAVDIAGAVVSPGVYALPEGSRVDDVISLAGGISNDADTEKIAKNINKASFVTDGMKLFIPQKSVSLRMESENSTGADDLISVNDASKKELESLSGVGPVTAEKIIDGRPYNALEDLINRKIIGISVWEKIQGDIML